MSPQRTGERAPSIRSARPKLAAITAGVTRLWQRRGAARSRAQLDAAHEQRLETIAARVEHLEAELEGLQDAVYRQAVQERENIGELRWRTDPEQLARELGRDARRRGL